MPYIHVKITRTGVTTQQKLQIIAGLSQVLQQVLDKDPNRTFVVIDEVDPQNWGIGGVSVASMPNNSKQGAQ